MAEISLLGIYRGVRHFPVWSRTMFGGNDCYHKRDTELKWKISVRRMSQVLPTCGFHDWYQTQPRNQYQRLAVSHLADKNHILSTVALIWLEVVTKSIVWLGDCLGGSWPPAQQNVSSDGYFPQRVSHSYADTLVCALLQMKKIS